jgi:hypothetical protein
VTPDHITTPIGCSPALAPERTSRRTKAWKTLICEETVGRCAQAYGDDLQAVVLTGSLARNEATLVEVSSSCHVLGDADFLLLFRERAPLPTNSAVETISRSVERALDERGVDCHVTLSAVHPAYLRKLGREIYAYELRVSGQVLWGDPTLLSLVPTFAASEISREDAWRLLCNRMIEQIEAVDGLVDTPRAPSSRIAYPTVKLYLDMATSYLVFAGAYEPTYRRRAERLKALAGAARSGDDAPFPLRDFADRVLACTEAKLLGPGQADRSILAPGTLLCKDTVEYARRLWRWELIRLTGFEAQLSDLALLEVWARLQPLHARLRGWLYVLRHQGWYRSWRNWPRWAALWRASPRYHAYAAASELLFRLPRLMAASEGRQEPIVDWHALHGRLPLVHDRRPGWRPLAADIVWNYHTFLEGTRA